MASQRQIQDKSESTQSDSIEHGAEQQELADRDRESKKTAKPAKSETGESTDNSQPSQKLESLVKILQGDLSEIDPDAALKTIDEIHKLVDKLKQPAAKEIASGLKELHKLLKRKEPTGHELGELISHLGEQTTNIASEAETEFKPPLQHLGKQLTKIGRSLAKAEDTEQHDALNELVDTLAAEPKQIELKAAIEQIERWYDLLHKSEDPSLQQIATELKDLKKLLKGNKVKAAELSDLLGKVGELTTTAAAAAPRGFKGVIQKLGKALSAIGKSLA
jgi:hypothetical protein